MRPINTVIEFKHIIDAGPSRFGLALPKGYGVPKDTSQARSLYERACDSGLQLAFHNLRELP